MDRRRFIKLSGFVAAGAVASAYTHSLAVPAEDRRPNIVLLVADDLGWNDVGYHNSAINTPHIDELVRTGVELDCHYVQPQCTPTRVALMTGRYPSRFGNHCTQASNEHAFGFGTVTMASMLKQAGYTTGIFGKWHLGSKQEWGPNHHGFDYSYGSLAGAIGMYDHRYRLDTPYAVTWHRNHEIIEEVGHATDLVTDEAVKWIRQKREKPFFAYVPFHTVHTPLVESHRSIAEYDEFENVDRRLFAAAVTHLDAAVGRIVAALDERGLREDTLIIFMSDNGGISTSYSGDNYPPPDPALSEGFSSNLPFRSGKTHVYEGGMRVPAFVNWSGHLRAGKTSALMHCVDWMPTLAGLVRFDSKSDLQWDGMDVWPWIAGRKGGVEGRQLYWVWGRQRERVALRKGDWKLLRERLGGNWELYNLADDPYERHDLAKDKPAMVEKLKEAIRQEKARDPL